MRRKTTQLTDKQRERWERDWRAYGRRMGFYTDPTPTRDSQRSEMQDTRISCQACIDAIERVTSGAEEFVGNQASPHMGHQMIFTTDGRAAACLKESRRPITNPAR